MATASDVVTQALKKAGILGDGQSADGDMTTDALTDLQDLLAQWSEKRWLIWHELQFSVTSTGQTTPYTVGPNGQFNMTPRPSRVMAAYARQLVNSGLPVDYQLDVIPSFEEWSRLALKSLSSFPKYCFLDSAYPLANFYVYPWPQNSIYQLWIVVKDVFPVSITSATSFASYPPMTIPAMKFNLARRLRQAYGKGLRPDPELNALAKDALETMRNAQVQVPELVIPKILVPRGGDRYNIYSDQAT